MLLFGKRLKELRKRENMTQKELGSRLNVTKVSICCYEKGTRIPSLDTLIDIANLFKVDINYLIGNDTYVVSDENVEYGLSVSTDEINLMKELRKHPLLYKRLLLDPKRVIEFAVMIDLLSLDEENLPLSVIELITPSFVSNGNDRDA